MSSTRSIVLTIRARVQRVVLAGLVVFALSVTPALGVAEGVSAQSTYGDSSFGTEIYSAEEEVLAPNTGFEIVTRAATAEPVLFWGGSSIVLGSILAGALVVRRMIKRKQEN